MDPQQRKLLEVTWEALEDGGQKPLDLAGADVGVFIGAFTLDYKTLQFSDLSFETIAAHTATGTMMTMVSNRISYCLDFRGPSLSVDTACSSSLVAVHLACRSLLSGETELALAGGTLLHMAPQYTIAESKSNFLSPDGRSRPFDAAANGYVRAESVGVVVLRRLSDAVRDGDPIHAVIRSTGVNQDGHTEGITVPNPEAQTALISKVCHEGGLVPGQLQYVEAHGTSTPVGDPLEARALGVALAIGRRPGARCYVGSVKANIGHAEAAAGIAGLIKVALSLEHGKIPPHINVEQLNPAIDLESLPFDIPTEVVTWPEHEGPALAGVNSFGFGGTNAHVVMEEPPRPAERRNAPADTEWRPEYSILPLSARDAVALQDVAASVSRELSGEPGEMSPDLTDLGYTLARRRQHLASRLAIVYSSGADLKERLDGFLRGEVHLRIRRGEVVCASERQLVWVFGGMGPQRRAMGRRLFTKEPVYRAVIERCDAEVLRIAGWSLIDHLNADGEESSMSEAWLAQPANFAVQAGLAALWRSRGVRPDAVVGHSAGEIASFHEAGVYSFEDALLVAIRRSQLQQQLSGTGGMLAVGLSESEAVLRIASSTDRVTIAAVNSPGSVTLAGDCAGLEEIAETLTREEIFVKRLAARIPYHSPGMDPIKNELVASLASLDPQPAELPLYLTSREGRAAGPELDGSYWWHNIRDTVRFGAAVDLLIQDGYRTFLEVGPHPVLAHSIQECLAHRGVSGRSLSSMRCGEDELSWFTRSLAELYTLGVDIDWTVLHPHGRQVPLDPYPWRRERYWIEPRVVSQIRRGERDHSLLGRRTAHGDPTWQATLDLEQLPYLADHQIQGNVVFPAAGYLEMAAQAARVLSGSAGAVLGEIELRKTLLIPENEARQVEVTVSAENASFAISTVTSSLSDDEDAGPERRVHAAGVIRVGQGRRAAPDLDRPAIQARTERRIEKSACYAELAKLGYHYGPAFRGIEEAWTSAEEALALIRPPAVVDLDTAGHHVHPALLDACFQTLLLTRLADKNAASDQSRYRGLLLPLSIDEVQLEHLGDQPFWAFATVTKRSGAELGGDIVLYAEDGRVLGRISGFRAVDVEHAPTTVSETTIDSWLAEVVWYEKSLDGQEERAVPEPPANGEWLIFTDSTGVGDHLAAQIEARGGQARLVRTGDAYHLGVDHHSAVVTPASRTDLERLIADLADDGCRTFTGIVHLWNLDQPELDLATGPDLVRSTDIGAYALVAMAQVLQEASVRGPLHVVTRGAQAAVPDEDVAPLMAPSWGVARVLRDQELTGSRGKLIDLERSDPRPDGTDQVRSAPQDAQAILREILLGTDDEVALRGGSRFRSRLVTAERLTHALPLRLRADGSYLVTGGFGALGRPLCRALVQHGARRIILLTRTPLPPRESWNLAAGDTSEQSIALVRDLEKAGAQVITGAVDVGDESALVSWLQQHRAANHPPIRGVFHLAGYVHDRLLADMDRSVFTAVQQPKVAGSLLLHRCLAEEPLDHFVLFSSLASLVTTAGQSSYAAGNAFLDALAHHRRALGLPALSINWGPWATGMIEDLGLADHYRTSRGMSLLSPEAGMNVLERIIGQDRAQLAVVTVVDQAAFLAWYASPPSLVSELITGTTVRSEECPSVLEHFRDAAEDERRELIAHRFLTLVEDILRVPAEQVDLATGLDALGMDSLLAMELRAKVGTELLVTLPVMSFLSATPVCDLVNLVHDELAERLTSAE